MQNRNGVRFPVALILTAILATNAVSVFASGCDTKPLAQDHTSMWISFLWEQLGLEGDPDASNSNEDAEMGPAVGPDGFTREDAEMGPAVGPDGLHDVDGHVIANH